MFLIGIITYILSEKGLVAVGISTDTNLNKIYKNYEIIDSLSNIKWFSMITAINRKNNIKIRTLIILLFWISIYIFKELFNYSINSAIV